MAQPNTNLVNTTKGLIDPTQAFGGRTQPIPTIGANPTPIGPTKPVPTIAQSFGMPNLGNLTNLSGSGNVSPITAKNTTLSAPNSKSSIASEQANSTTSGATGFGAGFLGTPKANAATGNVGQQNTTPQPVDKVAIQAQLDKAQADLKTLLAQQNAQNTNTNQVGFPGLVGQLANTAGNSTAGFNTAQNASQAATTALMGSAPQQNAAVLAKQQEIQDLMNAMANASAQTENRPGISLQQASGEEGILNRLYAQKLGAAETGLSNILQGNAQQQAAFTGAGNLANTAAGVATGQQGTQQSGLANAAGLAQPSYLAPGQSPYFPTTQQYGQLAGTQNGGGGLQGIGNISGQIGIGQNVAQQNALLGSAQKTGEALQQLITENNINPAGFTPLNGALQLGAAYTSNEAYRKFSGQMNDFINKVAPILGGPTGNTTDYKTQMAGSILGMWDSGETINNVISYFLNQAAKNIQGYSTGGGAGVGSIGGGNAGGFTFSQSMFQ